MKKLILSVICAIGFVSASFFISGCKIESKHTHEFTQKITDYEYLLSPATCTEKAKYYYSCECGEKGTETFDYGSPLGHNFGDYLSDDNATCIADGSKTAKCIRCNATDTVTDANTRLGHKFTNYVPDGNATCTKDGTKTAKCDRCNETDTITDANSKLQHTYNRQIAADKYLATTATCTKKATYYYACICGTKGTETYEYGAALGHNFTNYVSDRNATCTEDGTKTAKCDRCNETDTITDANTKTGHSFTNYVSDNNATYEKDGTKTAYCDHNGCTATDTIPDEGSMLESKMTFKTLSVNGNTVYGKVSNNTDSFSFIKEIETFGHIKFIVSLDIYGSQQVATKTIALKVGDNEAYVIEMDNDEPKTVYKVTIRRRPLYSVVFNTSGGSTVVSQTVEEDYNATIPQTLPTRPGYLFDSWAYDFSIPVIRNTTIVANWNIIVYNIFYELNGGIIDDLIPTTYTIEDEFTLTFNPEKTGYNFIEWSDSGKIEKGSIGDKIFTASYTPIIYTIAYDCGNGDNSSTNPETYTIESETITFNDPYYINADFVEWQISNKKITEIPKGSYGNITLTAVWNLYDVKLRDDGNTFAVIGRNTDKSNIVIKSTYKEKPVTQIAEKAFYDCTDIKSVVIPDSVSSIGEYAFYNCSGLTNITIPDNVTSIDSFTFKGCSSLTSVTIPDSVTHIGYSAFENCNKLEKITIPFIGESKTANNGYDQVLGYIFGYKIISNTTSIDGATYQYHGDKKDYYHYYIPKSLISIVIGNTANTIPENAFYNCNNLTSIIIDSNATSIGDSAFYNCNNLTSITIPDGTTNIGNSTFYNCSNLTSITIPDTITSIGANTFYNCYNLTKATMPYSITSIDSYAFFGCSGLTSVNYTGTIDQWTEICFNGVDSNPLYYANLYINNELVTAVNLTTSIKISDYAFNNYKSLTTVIISNSVAGIGNCAFYRCSSLTEIAIGNNVTSIGTRAFSDCTGLTNITIPDNVASISNYAFSGCTGLTNVTIPDSVANIGTYAFSGCTGLTNVTIPDSVANIGTYAFSGCTGLTNITIHDSITSIGEFAFFNCSSLKKITLPFIGASKTANNGYNQVLGYIFGYKITSNTTPINDTTYQWKDYYNSYHYYIPQSLTTVVIGNTANKIPYHAFYNCSKLTNITIPDSVKNIENAAFYGCKGLTSVTIPESITSIGSDAFSNCRSSIFNKYDNAYYLGNDTNNYIALITATTEDITTCIINENCKIISNRAFYNHESLTSVTIPDSVTSIGANAFQYCSISDIYITDLTAWCNIGNLGSLMSYSRNKLYLNNSLITNLIIPDSVTSIGDYAFAYCDNLTSITIPDSITSIGDYAFYCDNLTSITIPDSVTSIGNYAFSSCSDLKNVTIGNNVISIGEKSFYFCDNLTSIAIPDSVTSIGDCAFAYCDNLTSITIPDSVISIGDYAFTHCSNLTRVTIGNNGTSTTVGNNGINIGAGAFAYCSNLTSVTIGNNVTSIGESAFSKCSHLFSITLGNRVTSIGKYAFQWSYGLRSITLPESVISIGDSAFV